MPAGIATDEAANENGANAPAALEGLPVALPLTLLEPPVTPLAVVLMLLG